MPLDLLRGEITPEPYPHLTIDEWLPAAQFRSLLEDFPSEEDFARCSDIMGGRNNLIRGNPDFPRFVERSEPWRQLLAQLNSEVFARAVLARFASAAQDYRCRTSRHAPFIDYVEPARDAVKGNAAARSNDDELLPEKGNVYVTFDIARARTGYERGPHVDARYKVAAFLLFFNDCQDIDATGGIFNLHKVKPTVSLGERSIAYEDCAQTISVEPRANRVVFFLNCPSAYHSVSKLTAPGGFRKFLCGSVATYGHPDVWSSPVEGAE